LLVIALKSTKLAAMKRFLPLLLLLVSTTVLPDSGAYQVEIIVFRNLLATSELKEIPQLRYFSQYPDLAEAPGQDTQVNANANTATTAQADEATPVYRSDLPDELHVITQKSPQMDNAWRRLRSSQNYRPLVYTAWQQNQVDYYPPIRVHNQQVIDTRLHVPGSILIADLTAEDPLAAYRSDYFQIDGSLQLRRSRFLHLYADLEIRQPMSANTNPEEFESVRQEQFVTPAVGNEPAGFGVFSLKQNRQVTTGKMQYFDTPYFGLLVYVTDIQAN